MRWRLLLRNEFAELYVDDELIQGYTLPHVPDGRLGIRHRGRHSNRGQRTRLGNVPLGESNTTRPHN